MKKFGKNRRKEMNPFTGPRSGQEQTGKKRKKREEEVVQYRKGGYDTVVFVPPTPKSKLKKSFDGEIKKTDFKIKVLYLQERQLKDCYRS